MNRKNVSLGKRSNAIMAAVLGIGLCAASVLAQPATAPATGGRGNPNAQGGGGANSADYPFPYRVTTPAQISEVLGRVHAYVDANSASKLVSRQTGEAITDFSGPNPDATLEQRMFNIVGYEWGVTYCGMLMAADATGEAKYKDYVDKRLNVIANAFKVMPPQPAGRGGGGAGAAAGTQPAGAEQAARGGGGGAGGRGAGGGAGRGGLNFRSMTNPGSLDDSGSMCAALLKARAAGVGPDMLKQIETYINWIHTGQMRFSDGTLSRNRPHNESLWLDDLYMSVPALAHMGKMTGDKKYYDDACKQIIQFASRMFVQDVGLWAHGWTGKADEHPAFHWSRANGWAAMAMTELLEVLPADHPQRAEVMKIYKAHMRGLAKQQSADGLWHQVLDRHNSYLETSGTAMFVYAMARGVNRGWLDPITYIPVAMLGWNGMAGKINSQGQVEGTCVATDMAFDFAFYYYRPVSANAPHGYGPVLLAGGEMIKLVKGKEMRVNFSALHYTEPGYVPPMGGGRGGRGAGAGGGAGGPRGE